MFVVINNKTKLATIHVLFKTTYHPPSPGARQKLSPKGIQTKIPIKIYHIDLLFMLQLFYLSFLIFTWHLFQNYLTCSAYQWFWLANYYLTINNYTCLFRKFKNGFAWIVLFKWHGVITNSVEMYYPSMIYFLNYNIFNYY